MSVWKWRNISHSAINDMPIVQQGSSTITSSKSSLMDSMDHKKAAEESSYSFNSKYWIKLSWLLATYFLFCIEIGIPDLTICWLVIKAAIRNGICSRKWPLRQLNQKLRPALPMDLLFPGHRPLTVRVLRNPTTAMLSRNMATPNPFHLSSFSRTTVLK